MNELDAHAARVRSSAALAELLEAGFDAFEVIRLVTRACEDRAPGLFAALMTAAGTAVEGRKALNDAPSLPPARGGPPPAPTVSALASADRVADELAAFAALLAQRLAEARVQAVLAGDRVACERAARPAAEIRRPLARDTDETGLAAGHDLLQTHFTTDLAGWRHGTSPWAPAIVSQPVSAALITEIGGYAGRLAPWALQLAAAAPHERLPARARVAIGAGCRWLWVAEAAARVVRHHPDAAAGQALLHSIPVNRPPLRYPPRGGEPVPRLCAGAASTAERLGHLAYLTATRGYPPRAALATCWQRTAHAAAITGHCSERILRRLAEPAAGLPQTAAAETAITQAAHAAGRSWQAWRAAARAGDRRAVACVAGPERAAC